MSHVRERIRKAVVAAIKDARVEGLFDRVYPGRFFAVELDKGPAVLVFPEDEAMVATSAQQLAREVHMVVQVLVKEYDEAEDESDRVCAAIEAAVDPLLGGLAYDGRMFEARFERFGDGEREVMSASLMYAFKYMTAYRNGEAATH